jgi:hypothetical protein
MHSPQLVHTAPAVIIFPQLRYKVIARTKISLNVVLPGLIIAPWMMLQHLCWSLNTLMSVVFPCHANPKKASEINYHAVVRQKK